MPISLLSHPHLHRLSSSARIAQRFALVKIHKLWNSGRAEPSSGARAMVLRATDQDKDEGKGGSGEATKQAAAGATERESPAQHNGSCRRVQGEREEEEVARDQSESAQPLSRAQASLESTVAGVVGLPQEVLRRIVSYCTL